MFVSLWRETISAVIGLADFLVRKLGFKPTPIATIPCSVLHYWTGIVHFKVLAFFVLFHLAGRDG
jgi:hypothetical protein